MEAGWDNRYRKREVKKDCPVRGTRKNICNFTDSGIRLLDDTVAQVIAVEGYGRASPDYYTMLAFELPSIISSWDRFLGTSTHASFSLAGIPHQIKLIISFMSFNTSYTDAGLFGIYSLTENKDCQGDSIHSVPLGPRGSIVRIDIFECLPDYVHNR
ncbi:hypothetical protein BGZ51_003728 [Haplosporangium sp. Z 767]|nr:hypothetical protein BGZ51_003728 [Haplosporangium sp. Z 767]